MELLKFITPLYYTYRYNRVGLEGIAYFLEFTILPFVVYSIYSPTISLNELIIIVIIIQTSYEMGYIYNNTITIQIEKNPTIRHSQEEIIYVDHYLYTIYAIRIGIIILLIYYLYIIDSPYLAICILGVVSILSIFTLYNLVREGWINRSLFFLLRFSRYYFTLFFISFPSILVSLLISSVSLINNLSWYPTRTKISLPRFFGTKLFDGVIYLIFSIIMYMVDENSMGYIFLYLSLVKLILFGYKLFMQKVKNV